MTPKSMSSDEKFNHNAVGTILLLLGAPIAALGLFGIHFALTSYDAAPGLGPAAIFVTMIGGAAIWLAITLIRTARRAVTRPY